MRRRRPLDAPPTFQALALAATPWPIVVALFYGVWQIYPIFVILAVFVLALGSTLWSFGYALGGLRVDAAVVYTAWIVFGLAALPVWMAEILLRYFELKSLAPFQVITPCVLGLASILMAVQLFRQRPIALPHVAIGVAAIVIAVPSLLLFILHLASEPPFRTYFYGFNLWTLLPMSIAYLTLGIRSLWYPMPSTRSGLTTPVQGGSGHANGG